ncbi:hypothetical protein Tco_0232799 [Tanacetum coccineum]
MPGHLAARLGCAETKVATWDDLAFKFIILGWNVKTHEKRKRDAGSMSSEELVAWMTLKDFLHFPGNRSASFSEMAVAAPVANNAVGAEVVPPSAGRRWRGVVARLVGSPRRVIAPSSDVDPKGKRVAFPNSAGSLSFKKRKHVVLDEGPSSPKSVPDIAPSDEACKTLFGSLDSTEDPGDSDPFLPGLCLPARFVFVILFLVVCVFHFSSFEEALSSRDALCNLSYPDV